MAAQPVPKALGAHSCLVAAPVPDPLGYQTPAGRDDVTRQKATSQKIMRCEPDAASPNEAIPMRGLSMCTTAVSQSVDVDRCQTQALSQAIAWQQA